MSDADEDYFVPLEDQRVFGAGIKRKRVAFVPASSTEPLLPSEAGPKTTNAGDRYLSIVLPKKTTDELAEELTASNPNNAGTTICSLCKQPISTSADGLVAGVVTHESSIAHQVCLEHSHPPSHLDRDHVGVRYLSGYGWDPDSRKGLGARQEGIRAPIKAREKNDTAGLRERVDDEDDVGMKKGVAKKKKDEIVRLNAKEVRRAEMAAKKRAEKLRAVFYGQDLEQYLGPEG